MKFGLVNIGLVSSPDLAVQIAVLAEKAGFDRCGRWSTSSSRPTTNRRIPTRRPVGFPPRPGGASPTR